MENGFDKRVQEINIEVDLHKDKPAGSGLFLHPITGLVTLEPYQDLIVDVNGDGNVNVGDAILILRHSVGLITEFPAERL